MEEKSIKFDVKMTTKYMFEFLYVNSYSGSRGIINYCFSLIAILALIFGYGDSVYSMVALVVLALMFTVIDPFLLFVKAMRQVRVTQAFKNAITYEFKKEGFFVSQGTEMQEAPWEMILLAKETMGSIILFTGNNNAIILPKKCIGENLNDFKALLHEMRPAESAKIKK